MDEQSLQGYLESPSQNPSAQARVSKNCIKMLRVLYGIVKCIYLNILYAFDEKSKKHVSIKQFLIVHQPAVLSVGCIMLEFHRNFVR